MSAIEQELEATEIEARRDAAADELRVLAADAWQAYALMVYRSESDRVRFRAFEVAMRAERVLSEVAGRFWPLESASVR